MRFRVSIVGASGTLPSKCHKCTVDTVVLVEPAWSAVARVAVNKLCLNHVPAPSVISMMQFTCSAGFVIFLQVTGLAPVDAFEWDPRQRLFSAAGRKELGAWRDNPQFRIAFPWAMPHATIKETAPEEAALDATAPEDAAPEEAVAAVLGLVDLAALAFDPEEEPRDAEALEPPRGREGRHLRQPGNCDAAGERRWTMRRSGVAVPLLLLERAQPSLLWTRRCFSLSMLAQFHPFAMHLAAWV